MLEPHTVVALTLAIVSLLAVVVVPFVVENDDALRTTTVFCTLLAGMLFAIGISCLAADLGKAPTHAPCAEVSK